MESSELRNWLRPRTSLTTPNQRAMRTTISEFLFVSILSCTGTVLGLGLSAFFHPNHNDARASAFDNRVCVPSSTNPVITYTVPGSSTPVSVSFHSTLDCSATGSRGCNFCVRFVTFRSDEISPNTWARLTDTSGNSINVQTTLFGPAPNWWKSYPVNCNSSTSITDAATAVDLQAPSSGRYYYTTGVTIYYVDCASVTFGGTAPDDWNTQDSSIYTAS